MKASDISDFTIYCAVRQVTAEFVRVHRAEPAGASLWDIQKALPGYPSKVVTAKLAQMVNNGRLEGCPGANLRGDYRIPERLKVDGNLMTPVETRKYLLDNGVGEV